MSNMTRWMRSGLVAVALAAGSMAAAAGDPPTDVSIDLSQSFGTRSPWRFTASPGPAIKDPFGLGDDQVPGVLTLCLRTPSTPCDPQLRSQFRRPSSDDFFSEPHYLNQAQVVHPNGEAGRPILLVQTASLHAGDGDQVVLEQALAYDKGPDHFRRVYQHVTGANNNQEVRYIDAGPLRGDIIAVDPTETAPFGFWVSVNALAANYTYKEVLRYRSATHYADGNPLAVIDSEMPTIQLRLGVWKPGLPLPLPASPCPKPHMIQKELWCS